MFTGTVSKLWGPVSNPDLYHQEPSLVPLPQGFTNLYQNPRVPSENRSGINFKGGPGFVFLACAPVDGDNILKTKNIKPSMLPLWWL